MAITPEQAAGLTTEDLRSVLDHEKQIDLSLLTTLDPQKLPFRFYVGNMKYPKVQQELIRRYELAGWTARFEVTGDSITFVLDVPAGIKSPSLNRFEKLV